LVELGVVPHEQSHLVVLGSPVRKSAPIVAAWLQSLAWQVLPRNVQLYPLFIDDGCDAETRSLLDQFVAERGGLVVDSAAKGVPDFADTGETHHWTGTAMERVGAHKDYILSFARTNRAEACWLVDADLILDPMTLSSLWSVPEQVTAAVYWTRWSEVPPEHPRVHAGPQVWLAHPYTLQGMGMEEWEFRRALVNRQLTQVLGLGACTLIRREALNRGVSFAKWPGNNIPGIGQGEDRMFCMRAESLHLRMVADPWPDIWHCYHPSDVALIPEMLQRLRKVRDGIYHDSFAVGDPPVRNGTYRPELGHLISLKLRALEPVATQQGRMYAPPQLVRGRVGRLTLHPELEDAVLSMERGEVRVVPVHFGLDYPFGEYRGQRRLIEVTLIDHKPMGYPPVVEDELIVNAAGSAMDQTNLTPEVIDLMREVHG
jgi:hypothetical protein